MRTRSCVHKRRLRADLETVMREAGALARATASRPFKRWTKGAGPFAGERGRHRRQRSAARAAFGADAGRRLAVGGNRGRPRRAQHGSAWIVDPIDGTRAFIAGRPDWTISVALVEDGRPVVAALYAPVTEEMFLAVRTRAPSSTARRSRSAAATVSPARNWPARNAIWIGSKRSAATSCPSPRCIRSRCVWRAWRKARSTPLSPRAAATTGTLQPPIFWCTKPAGS